MQEAGQMTREFLTPSSIEGNPSGDGDLPAEGLLLYQELAEWYPLLTPVADYAEEAAFYLSLFESHCDRSPRTLLDLGSGGGHNAAHLKSGLSCTLVDLAPAMLSLSRRLNPECEHIQGDMRSIRLGRAFDCIMLHDAVSYMTSRDDLAKAITTAFVHTAPGGVALFQPDFVRETFQEGTETGGSDDDGRALRYLEWRWAPASNSSTHVTDIAYMLRDEQGATRVLHDRHRMGLFSRNDWLDMIAEAGFRPIAVPFHHSSHCGSGHDVFLGLRPGPAPAEENGPPHGQKGLFF
jgi:SAM-dependent methyltransferase